MQDDSGARRLLTFSLVYKAFQRLVGSGQARRWLSQEFWRLSADQKLLDIGCGPGSIIQYLPPGVRYVGFDISEEYVSHARCRYRGDPDKVFLVGTAEDFIESLPPEMEGADLVVMNGLMHHLEDHEALNALKLARAALAPRGRLVCLEPSFLMRQSPLSRWLLEQDRGRNVRSEHEWKILVSNVFPSFETHIMTGLLRIPYTHIVIEAYP